MSTNDSVLVQQILEQRKNSLAPDMSDSDYFEVFTAEEVLKDYALTYDEIEGGIIGGGNDGGIDGIWLFANGDLVVEDTVIAELPKSLELELVVIQAKRTGGFKEDPLNRLKAVFENLLDLSNSLSDFTQTYNSDLLSKIELFRETHRQLASRFPKLTFRVVYSTLGSEVHKNVDLKAKSVVAKLDELFSASNSTLEFLGAAELLNLARKKPKTSFTLQLAENAISPPGAVSYVCLVTLTNYHDFITDDQGQIRANIFESNVRDYQGKTEVNKEIRETLADQETEDFWWLNNGITILASQATQSSKSLTVEDPQIVNGLQTSRQIHDHFSSLESEEEDKRLVLIRVIVPEEGSSRDKIIKATNSQTSIPPASLKATDKVQRDIEDYLKKHGIYYDRRKNFYKNQGKPIADIIGIAKMSQAVMAILLSRPDTARARPSTLIKSQADYPKIFSTSLPIEIYLACARILRSVEAHLKSNSSLDSKDRNNIRFYVALEVARGMTGKKSPTAPDLKTIAEQEIQSADLISCTSRVIKEYNTLGGTDQVAKGSELRQKLTLLHAG